MIDKIMMLPLPLLACWYLVLYFFIVEPIIRLLCQMIPPLERLVYKLSFLIALPTPMSYGKWRIWSMFLFIFPVKVESPDSPWEVGKLTVDDNLNRLRSNPDIFKVKWD